MKLEEGAGTGSGLRQGRSRRLSARVARLLAWAVLILVALALLVGAAVAAVFYLPAFEEGRQALAEELLEVVFEREADIAGPVRVEPGAIIVVTMEDVTLGEGRPDAWQGELAVREVRFDLLLWPALVGAFELERFAARGLAVDLVADENDEPFRIGGVVGPIVRLLDAGVAQEFLIEDASIVRRGDPDGWNGEARFYRLEARVDDEPRSRTVSIVGDVEGAPLRVDATFAAPVETADSEEWRAFTIRSVVPGIEQVIEGTIDSAGQMVGATVRMDVVSLGDFLEVLLLRRQLEGEATLTMRVSGDIDALVADDVELAATLKTGERLAMEGRIGNLSTLDQIDLGFRARLERHDGSGILPMDALEILLEGVEGRITGSAEAATLTGVLLDTNLAAADIEEIGPVSVARVTRDEEGRLGLRGIHVLSGEREPPTLDLQGDIDDLLGGSGIRLEGSFNLDVLEIATGVPAPPELGRLIGEVAITDQAGPLRVARMSAEVAGDGPLTLVLERSADESDQPVAIRLEIPDLDALGLALAAEPVGGGAMSFSGTIDLVDDLHLVGEGGIGHSPFVVDVHQDVTERGLVFRGRVESDALHLEDLRRVVRLPDLLPERANGMLRLQEDAPTGLDAELDVQGQIAVETGEARGDFTARLYYREGEATLRSFRLAYLGGELEAEAVMGSETAEPVAISGSARQLNLEALLNELGMTPLVTGTLDGRFELEATGDELDMALVTLDGMVEAWVEGGTIGTNLIDLTGLNVVEWLVSRNDATRLVCADVRLDFAQGVGTVGRMVMETDNVQLRGAGSIDLKEDRLDLAFEPRALREGLVRTVTPFRIEGNVTDPEVIMPGAGVAGRALAETLTLPFNVLGAIIGGGRGAADRQPCVLAE